jgi:hypothetical protein
MVYGVSHRAGQLEETGSLRPREERRKTREGDPNRWSTVIVTLLGSWGSRSPVGKRRKRRERP